LFESPVAQLQEPFEGSHFIAVLQTAVACKLCLPPPFVILTVAFFLKLSQTATANRDTRHKTQDIQHLKLCSL